MTLGKSLRLYLVDGEPNGLITAEIMNWTGHIITGQRSKLSDLIQRSEAKRTGVYILLGPEQAIPEVYIGESDDIAKRLTSHNKDENSGGKDFWERVCIVTSKDGNLTKGHVKFIESRLIQMAKEAGRCQLVNNHEPDYTNLPESDLSDMKFFISQMQVLLPVLGIGFLRPTPAITPSPYADTVAPTSAISPLFTGDVIKYGIVAQGREIDGEFVVLKGSKARRYWEGQTQTGSSYELLFDALIDTKVLVPTPDDKLNEFTRDYAFRSPSAAGSVVTGRSTNGRTHWIDKITNKTYAQWQEDLSLTNTLTSLASQP